MPRSRPNDMGQSPARNRAFLAPRRTAAVSLNESKRQHHRSARRVRIPTNNTAQAGTGRTCRHKSRITKTPELDASRYKDRSASAFGARNGRPRQE